MASLGKGSLRLQILLILLVVLVVPILVMLYNIFYAVKSDEIVLENKQKRLIETVSEIILILEDSFFENDDPGAAFKQIVEPVVTNNEGVRLGLYLVANDEMYIEGFLHQFNKELSLDEQVERERRIEEEVIAGIKSALASRDTIVRLGRTWDDEFLECLSPVIRNGEPVAVVWAEERLNPIFAKNYHFRQATNYVILIGFCIGIFGLLAIIINLNKSIALIKNGLETLEKNINYRMAPMQGEIGQIAKAINKMAVSLAEKERLKEELRRADFLASLGQLVTGIAHELRNPLGVLRATVEVMEDDLKECKGIGGYVQRIQKQIERQSTTVNQLLDYGRPDDGLLETINVNSLVQHVLDFAQPLLFKEDIKLDIQLNENLQPIVGSSEKLHQVFLNIIINAVQSMPQGGLLRVRSSEPGEWVLVSIEDAGKGISPEDLPHIFEPFYTNKHGGSGLGLAISQQIVGIHGGKITAQSTVDRGTNINVYLPVKGGDASRE